jgi:hypothetical protein
MIDAALLALVLVALGAHAVVPWQVAADAAARRRWGLAAPPLLLAGGVAAVLLARLHPDEALATNLLPLLAGREGRLLAVLYPAVLAFDLLAALGWRRLPPAALRIGGAFGAALLAAGSLAGELLRVGEGPNGGATALLLAAACRLVIGLGAGEVFAPRRPLLALAAGLALPAWALVLPRELQAPLWAGGGAFTLAGAALLFLAARFLPPRFGRPALAGATLLAGGLIAQAAVLSQALSAQPLPPLPPLPVP